MGNKLISKITVELVHLSVAGCFADVGDDGGSSSTRAILFCFVLGSSMVSHYPLCEGN